MSSSWFAWFAWCPSFDRESFTIERIFCSLNLLIGNRRQRQHTAFWRDQAKYIRSISSDNPCTLLFVFSGQQANRVVKHALLWDCSCLGSPAAVPVCVSRTRDTVNCAITPSDRLSHCISCYYKYFYQGIVESYIQDGVQYVDRSDIIRCQDVSKL